MKQCEKLPEQYRETNKISVEDKKVSRLLNTLSVIIGLVIYFQALVVRGYLFLTMPKVMILMMLVAIVLYSPLHEGLHGVAMKMLGTKRVEYKFGLKFSSARSADYYSKAGQLIVLLTPVIMCTLVFTVLQMCMSDMWFWVFVMLHMRNLAGAVGDIYAAIKITQMPANIMIQDKGLCLSIYTKN